MDEVTIRTVKRPSQTPSILKNRTLEQDTKPISKKWMFRLPPWSKGTGQSMTKGRLAET